MPIISRRPAQYIETTDSDNDITYIRERQTCNRCFLDVLERTTIIEIKHFLFQNGSYQNACLIHYEIEL
ncbi:MAG TPA: hypothetical protein P5048_00135 [Chlamydiales bacterium]|nr:hypothetical protein [Chlamydiales bacterium]